MRANYGYTDGSGDWYLTVDTDLCDGCGECVEACPEGALVCEYDDYDDLVAMVVDDHRKKLKYTCGPCQPQEGQTDRPCVAVCPHGAISHSF